MLHSEFLLNQRPGIASARGAKEWLKDLPLTDARAAQHSVAALIAELDDADMSARDRLEIMETMRGHIAEIGARYAVRYAAKPLPLGLAERTAFLHACALWRRQATVYMRCALAAIGDECELAPHRALCLSRAAGFHCEVLVGHARAGQADDPAIFDELQRIAEIAAEQQVLDAPVRDSLHPRGVTSVGATCRRALLIWLGTDLGVGREREAMFDLARAWEHKTTLAWPRIGGADAAVPPPDVLAGTEGPRVRLRAIRIGRRTYVLDVTALARSLHRRLRKLAAGEPAESLRLPSSLQHACAAGVLRRLAGVWCGDVSVPVDARRAPASAGVAPVGGCPVALSSAGDDFAAMYCMVEGKAFVLDEVADITSRSRFDELFVFQHAGRARFEASTHATTRAFEEWHITGEVAGGFRLARARVGARFKTGQLVAMRLRHPGNDGPVVLAEIRRLAEPNHSPHGPQPGALDAEVGLLAGKPHGVAVRDAGAGRAAGGSHTAAFRLGSLQGAAQVSLVTPCGWFRPGREVVMRDGEVVRRLRMERLARRGLDFDLIEAAPVGAESAA